MEEAIQDAGRNDIKAEIRVMASALSKEMGMMEAQLKRWKETAHEAISLHEEAQALKTLLTDKTNLRKCLAEECVEQIVETKSLNSLIEKFQNEKLELQIFLDMYGQEGYDNRDVMQIIESRNKAYSQAEILKNALDEHSLELRVKAANEAEAACQERLSVAEAEIADLRAKLDASERDVLELMEAIKSKDGESETYISEIETIGQAYEDMQAQNQHLLQQMTERDDYNIKLVSESVKTKQAHSSLLSENQTLLAGQLKQVNSSIESVKMRIVQSQEQMKFQRKVDEFQWKLDEELSQRKKLEEELNELNSKNCKNILKCGVCFDRPKEIVIVKCYHLFCNPCIQRNLEIRHRKCLGCGTAFGQNDVRFVKI
ncbi:hypothetical protein V6N13_113586 [Hibiscus sabdariffa]